MFKWISKLFSFDGNDNTLIGLSQLRDTKEPVKTPVKVAKPKEVKLSDLMRGNL